MWRGPRSPRNPAGKGTHPFTRGISPVSRDLFFRRSEFSEISFIRNAAGMVTRIGWKPYGGDVYFLDKVANSEKPADERLGSMTTFNRGPLLPWTSRSGGK